MAPAAQPPGRRVALVHDFLLDLRGAERVFEVMCEMWPQADIFTAVYDERGTEGRFGHRNVNTSFLQTLRPTARTFRALLPLYPRAMERLDLSAYDLVVSSSSAWAHGVRPREGAVHVCYCYNPFRYAWNARESTLARRDPLSRALLAPVLERWQSWDRAAARRVTAYVSISQLTRERVARSFGRDSTIVHPPVAIDRFAPAPPAAVGDQHLLVSELVAHKRIDVAVEAFNRLGRPLVVVGDGPDERRLRRLAGPTVRFAGRLSDEQVAEEMARCRALVVTSTEEFGLAAVEAQAAGRPVVALDEGGARETVLDGVTGTFYAEPTPQSLVAALEGWDPEGADPAACAANAARFGPDRFRAGLGAAVAAACAAREPVAAH